MVAAAAPALVAAAKEDAGCFPDSDPAMEEEDRDSSVECIESSVEAASEPDPWRTEDVDLFTFMPDPDPVYGGRGYWIEAAAVMEAAGAAGEAEPAPRTILRAMPVGVVEPAADAAVAAGSWRAPLADDSEPSEPGSEPEPEAVKVESGESDDPEKEPAFGQAASWLTQPKKKEETDDEEMEDGAEIPVPVKACQTDPPSTL